MVGKNRASIHIGKKRRQGACQIQVTESESWDDDFNFDIQDEYTNPNIQLRDFLTKEYLQKKQFNLSQDEFKQYQDMFQLAYGGTLSQDLSKPDKNDFWSWWWFKFSKKGIRTYHLPNGVSGKKFVALLTQEIQHLTNEIFTSERLMLFCMTILARKPSIRKGSDIKLLIKRRLDMWEKGQFKQLFREIDSLLQNKTKTKQDTRDLRSDVVTKFRNLMQVGKTRQAVRLLTERDQSGILKYDDEVMSKQNIPTGKKVFEVLQELHPPMNTPSLDSIVTPEPMPHMPALDITSAQIEKSARAIRGSHGISGGDAHLWTQVLLRFGSYSVKLRDAVASLARKLANTLVDWKLIRALYSNRCVPLNKTPGVRPIGIGETLRRLISKTIINLTCHEAQQVCGSDQLSCGLQSGIEGAFHTISDMYQNLQPGEGILLVDADNAFNTSNRIASLLNARVLWPSAATYLFNSYRGSSMCFLDNYNDVIFSSEGVTQGDPLAMYSFGIGSMPLIQKLQNFNKWTQVWYADDSAAKSKFQQLLEWFGLLTSLGKNYGYTPNEQKCKVLVKNDDIETAKKAFCDTQIPVVTGAEYLGGYIGPQDQIDNFIKHKVERWEQCIEQLSVATEDEPQCTLSALTHSLQHEWLYVTKLHPDISEHFRPLTDQISNEFIPKLLGSQTSDIENQLFCQPLKWGGLGIDNPSEYKFDPYYNSYESTKPLQEALKGQSFFDRQQHIEKIKSVKSEVQQQKDAKCKQQYELLQQHLPPGQYTAVSRIVENKCSNWLSVLPIKSLGFDLSAQQFRDALSIRYHRPLLQTPQVCDGCGEQFTLQHALDCKVGGLIIARHNEVRDTFGDISQLVWKEIVREPIVQEENLQQQKLVADLSVRSVWEQYQQAVFDVRIVNSEAKSYQNQSLSSILKQAENQKHTKYDQACQQRRASFTPLILTVHGIMGDETQMFLKQASKAMAEKWGKSYSEIMTWLRAKVQFSVLRATNMCLRGSRRRWRSIGFEDGAGVPHILDV